MPMLLTHRSYSVTIQYTEHQSGHLSIMIYIINVRRLPIFPQGNDIMELIFQACNIYHYVITPLMDVTVHINAFKTQ